MNLNSILTFAAALVAVNLLCPLSAVAQERGSNVAATKHNLSASGPGPVKTTGQANVCAFCHTPHASSPDAPLWNRPDPGVYYQTYESSTMLASVGQPTGTSRLCLSCHDGTIALTQTINPLNSPGSTTVYLSAGHRGYIGTDLSDDHPISFIYTSDLASQKPELRDPAGLPPNLPLDHDQRLQCTTCHDAHDDTFGQFLRMDNTRSGMCVSCHDMTGWPSSGHATSTANLAAATTDQWDNLTASNVRDAACGSCHRPHTAGGRQRLLRHEPEENNCLNCHNGTVAQTNIEAQTLKLSAHPLSEATGVHDPTENPLTMNRHAECIDCHNPHQTTSVGAAQAPFLKPSMTGASGLSDTGVIIKEARYEYEVCYKCHSVQNFATPVVDRQAGTNNIAEEFAPTNASFHPVQTQGRNTFVPSLLQPYTTSSVIYCTDCHGSDSPTAPRGPHGSNFQPLLSADYTTLDNSPESPQAYALCYQCHNRNSILNDESFRKHKQHIVDKRTPCSVCHDPHGSAENPHLINFDRNVVQPRDNGDGPSYTSLGNRNSSCVLKCHGVDHDGQED